MDYTAHKNDAQWKRHSLEEGKIGRGGSGLLICDGCLPHSALREEQVPPLPQLRRRLPAFDAFSHQRVEQRAYARAEASLLLTLDAVGSGELGRTRGADGETAGCRRRAEEEGGTVRARELVDRRG